MSDIFDTGTTFKQLGLSAPILRAVDDMGFTHPTYVQAEVIPIALAGRDILAQSKTGTGKTAAFGIPVLEKISRTKTPFGSLILCPVRELAVQVAHELRNLTRHTDLRVLPVYGGQRMNVQIPKLKKGPHVIVGTPGRVMDFHRRGLLPYEHVEVAVLDEVDRMLDIGFREDIRRILGGMRQEHQTIFVSATIGDEIEKLARRYLKNPEKLVLTASSLTVSQVTQHHFSVERWDKNRLLVHLLTHETPALTLVFCRTKQTVDGLCSYLNRKGIEAHAIHGDLHQGKRNSVMAKLRSGELSVLVASDLAARGLDVDDITHVINFDLPEDPEVYVHRIGRTARAGRDGIAWSFVTPDQGNLLTNIEKLTNVEIELADYPDFEPGPVPKAVQMERERKAELDATRLVTHSRVATEPPPEKDAVDPTKFPGGKVPTAMPKRRMGGRVRTRRR
ncbi:MAG: DEAD/DEAH box helicase [Phycisphaerales bacterium]|nr:DEAD/DEAH box helicase [Phycisphaerales bacterium]NNM25337.1 DEAD/DEAH box helicase [Phycisphaerales bacterium]